MIDWITAMIPLTHSKEISSGIVMSVDENGETEWMTKKRQKVEGSYSSSIQIKTDDINQVWISGNPAKFLQGHNIFGSNDVLGLNYAFFQRVAQKLNITPSTIDLKSWKEGEYEIKRIDLTTSFALRNQQDVQAWLRAATANARGKHQNISAYNSETVYLGQHSRRITMKVYNKYAELQKHKLPLGLPLREKLLQYSENLLRLEVRLLSQELKRRLLNRAKMWGNIDIINEIIRERIMTIRTNEKFRLTPNEISDLPPRLVGIYRLWTNGDDLKNIYPSRTFYRYRSEMLKHGIDITVPQPKKAEVIPLIKYLTAEHVQEIPDWSKNTPIYFEPKQYVG